MVESVFAFANVQNIILPYSVEYLPAGIFDFSQVENLRFRIENNNYLGGSGEIIVPTNVCTIGQFAFGHMPNIDRLVLKDNITSVGESIAIGWHNGQVVDVFFNEGKCPPGWSQSPNQSWNYQPGATIDWGTPVMEISYIANPYVVFNNLPSTASQGNTVNFSITVNDAFTQSTPSVRVLMNGQVSYAVRNASASAEHVHVFSFIATHNAILSAVSMGLNTYTVTLTSTDYVVFTSSSTIVTHGQDFTFAVAARMPFTQNAHLIQVHVNGAFFASDARSHTIPAYRVTGNLNITSPIALPRNVYAVTANSTAYVVFNAGSAAVHGQPFVFNVGTHSHFSQSAHLIRVYVNGVFLSTGVGSRTVPADRVNGPIIITSSTVMTPDVHLVTANSTNYVLLTAPSMATQGQEFTFTVAVRTQFAQSTHLIRVYVNGVFLATGVGSRTVSADRVNGPIIISSPTILSPNIYTVTANSTNYVLFTAPSAATHGQAFSFTVAARTPFTQNAHLIRVYVNGTFFAVGTGTLTVPSSMVTGAITITSPTVVPPNLYRITLNKQGGTGGTVHFDVVHGNQLPTIEIPTRTDHLFQGYFASANGQGARFFNADGTRAHNAVWTAGAATMHAHWVFIDFALVAQPVANITNTGSHRIIFELRGPTRAFLEQFELQALTHNFAINNFDITIHPVSIVQRGSVWVKTLMRDMNLRANSLGGGNFQFFANVLHNGNIVSSLVTQNITVHHIIRTVAQFNNMFAWNAQTPNFEVHLRSDLNLGTLAQDSSRINRGILNGNNYLITYTMNINSSMGPNSALRLTLFWENLGTISNLRINANVTDANWPRVNGAATVGAIAAYNARNARIENITATINANIVSPRSSIGGIAAVNSGIISNSTVSGDLRTPMVDGTRIGGIVDINWPGAQILNSTNRATISGFSNIGGIAAQNDGLISGSVNEGNLTLNFNNVRINNNTALFVNNRAIGGIAGSLNSNFAGATITNSRNSGVIRFHFLAQNASDVQPSMGQIVGRNFEGTLTGNSNTAPGRVDVSNLITNHGGSWNQQLHAGNRHVGRNG